MKIRLKPPATSYRRYVYNADGNHVRTLRLRPGETLETDEDDLLAIELDLTSERATIEEVPEPEE